MTLINSPTDWTVEYDLNTNGTYEHEQGGVCGPKAGMKTNYTLGRKANIKLSEDGTVVAMEFLNVSLTKTGLTSKTRKISTVGDLIHDTAEGYVGMPSDTRDKIINNLHPEVCRITIPTTGGDCSELWHCDDNGDNCQDRTAEASLSSSTVNSCTWDIPYCEFSTWDADGNPVSENNNNPEGSDFPSSSSSNPADDGEQEADESLDIVNGEDGEINEEDDSNLDEELSSEMDSFIFWVFGGVVVVLAVGILVWIFRKRKIL